MPAIALPTPLGRGYHRLARAGHVLGQFVLAFGEGVAAARRYEVFSRMSDAELARLGLRRDEVAYFATFGRPRERVDDGDRAPDAPE